MLRKLKTAILHHSTYASNSMRLRGKRLRQRAQAREKRRREKIRLFTEGILDPFDPVSSQCIQQYDIEAAGAFRLA